MPQDSRRVPSAQRLWASCGVVCAGVGRQVTPGAAYSYRWSYPGH